MVGVVTVEPLDEVASTARWNVGFPAVTVHDSIGDPQVTRFTQQGIGLFDARNFIEHDQAAKQALIGGLPTGNQVLQSQVVAVPAWLIVVEPAAVPQTAVMVSSTKQ